MLGVLQSTTGSLAAGTVSLLADGTALPMAAVMLACGGAALLLVLGDRAPAADEPALAAPAPRERRSVAT